MFRTYSNIKLYQFNVILKYVTSINKALQRPCIKTWFNLLKTWTARGITLISQTKGSPILTQSISPFLTDLIPLLIPHNHQSRSQRPPSYPLYKRNGGSVSTEKGTCAQTSRKEAARWFSLLAISTSFNAPWLLLNTLQSHCLWFLWERLKYPGKIRNNGYARFEGGGVG